MRLRCQQKKPVTADAASQRREKASKGGCHEGLRRRRCRRRPRANTEDRGLGCLQWPWRKKRDQWGKQKDHTARTRQMMNTSCLTCWACKERMRAPGRKTARRLHVRQRRRSSHGREENDTVTTVFGLTNVRRFEREQHGGLEVILEPYVCQHAQRTRWRKKKAAINHRNRRPRFRVVAKRVC